MLVSLVPLSDTHGARVARELDVFIARRKRPSVSAAGTVADGQVPMKLAAECQEVVEAGRSS